jgi:hypothetical protein
VILEENSDRKPLRGAVTTLSNRAREVAPILCSVAGTTPTNVLPVTRQRDAAAVLILECLHDLELKIGDLLQKLRYPILEFVLRNNVDAARGNDESSNTNLSIASTSCGAFQTAAQKSSTILTEFICPLFYGTAIHSARPRQPPATRRGATELRFPLSIDSNYGLGNFST